MRGGPDKSSTSSFAPLRPFGREPLTPLRFRSRLCLSLAALTPANSVTGVVNINGRKVVVSGGDFTIRGGAADGSIADKSGWAVKHAFTRRIPLVRLLDATGGSVRTFETMGRTYLPAND